MIIALTLEKITLLATLAVLFYSAVPRVEKYYLIPSCTVYS